MNCAKREMDLLMMAHGETTGVGKVKAQLHLVACSECRARLKKFYAVSSSVAVNLENPRLGARTLKRPINLGQIGLLLIVLAILAIIISFEVQRQQSINPVDTNSSNLSCSIHANRKYELKLNRDFNVFGPISG